MKTESIGGSKYILTFIDYSRWCQVYFLKTKDEVLQLFKEFKKYAETLTEKKIKYLQTDNGGSIATQDLMNF